jgi:hypothetical protein
MTDTINDVAVEAAAQEEPVEPAIDEQSVAEQLLAPGPGEGHRVGRPEWAAYVAKALDITRFELYESYLDEEYTNNKAKRLMIKS